MDTTSAFTLLVPKPISIISPGFTLTEALATFPLTITRPTSQASLATVLLLIRRETFKNLSNLANTLLIHRIGEDFLPYPIRYNNQLTAKLVFASLGRRRARGLHSVPVVAGQAVYVSLRSLLDACHWHAATLALSNTGTQRRCPLPCKWPLAQARRPLAGLIAQNGCRLLIRRHP